MIRVTGNHGKRERERERKRKRERKTGKGRQVHWWYLYRLDIALVSWSLLDSIPLFLPWGENEESAHACIQ